MEKPTAEYIVARLTEEYVHFPVLLHKVMKPYEHYSDERNEEIPYRAIAKWQEVTI